MLKHEADDSNELGKPPRAVPPASERGNESNASGSAAGLPSRKRRRTNTDSGLLKSEEEKPTKRQLASLVPYDTLDEHTIVDYSDSLGSQVIKSDVKPKTRIELAEAQDSVGKRTDGSITPTAMKRGQRDPVPIRLEVLVPLLRDVRRLQATTDAATLQSRQASAPATTGPPLLGGSPTHPTTIETEPIEHEQDLKPHDPLVLPRSLDDRRLRAAIEELRNPDVKVKKELLLSDEFLLDALTWEGINHRYPIPVPPEIANCGFSRPYISHLYGGSLRATFPSPSPDMLEWHGLDDWAFLNLDYCPHAPTRPGYSGLHFSSYRARSTWEKLSTPLRTFVKLASSRWVYMGQYLLAPGKSLTTTAWMEQKPEVRKTWSTGLLNKQWGINVLLRVWFRKTRGKDYEPTKEDFADATINVKDIRKAMTEQEIVDAYTRGEEEIGTYTMTCVGYDVPFVRVLEANAHRFVPSTQDGKKGAKKSNVNNSKGKRNSSTSKKISKGVRRTDRAKERREASSSEDGHDESDVVMERWSTRARVKRVRTS